MATPQAIACIPIDADLQTLLTNLPEFDWSSADSLSPLSSLASSPSPSPTIPPQDSAHAPTAFQLNPPTPIDGADRAKTPSDLNKSSAGRCDRQKKKSHARQKAARQRVKASKKLEDLTARPQARRKYVKASTPLDVDMDASSFPASSSGYIAVGDHGGRRVFKIQDLIGPQSKHGLKLVDWDGMCVCFLAVAASIRQTNGEPQHTYAPPRQEGENYRNPGRQTRRSQLDEHPSTSRRGNQGV